MRFGYCRPSKLASLWISSTSIATLTTKTSCFSFSFLKPTPILSATSSSTTTAFSGLCRGSRLFVSSSSSSAPVLGFADKYRAYRQYHQNIYTTGGMASAATPKPPRLFSSTADDEKGDVTTHHKVALCQFRVSDKKEVNFKTCTEYVDRAVSEHNAKLIVLPEIWNSPYATAAFREYAEIIPDVVDKPTSTENLSSSSPSVSLLKELSIKHNVWIVGGSIPEIVPNDDDKIYNTCCVFNPSGQIVAKHRKVHLFDIDVPNGITFKESDTLTAGSALSSFDTGSDLFGTIGVGICYDMRFPEYALLLNKRTPLNLLIYPGAFNMVTGPAHWELLLRSRAVDNQCYVLAASPARSEEPTKPGKYPHYTAWGHSSIINPWGEVISTCADEETIVISDIDLSKIQHVRTSIPVSQQKRYDLYTIDGEG